MQQVQRVVNSFILLLDVGIEFAGCSTDIPPSVNRNITVTLSIIKFIENIVLLTFITFIG
uniref:Uncharacterized protein n=1 Tax=Rhizophagus irregularis (strain DAOM 181602 / DAOM 197198 / MUCL 43194) TaxID=747089 RepID=U9TDB2_RHIID